MDKKGRFGLGIIFILFFLCLVFIPFNSQVSAASLVLKNNSDCYGFDFGPGFGYGRGYLSIELNESFIENYTAINFSLVNYSVLSGNYDSQTLDVFSDAFTDSNYVLEVYIGNNTNNTKLLKKYTFGTSLIYFYDTFSDNSSEDPGGMGILDSNLNVLLIPNYPTISFIKILLNGTVINQFKINSSELNCTEKCILEGKVGNYSSKDYCCSGLIKARNYTNKDKFTCVSCGDGVCSANEDEYTCFEDCFKDTFTCPAGMFKGKYDCKIIPVCGNGIAELSNNEDCDDGNNKSGDGCSSTCKGEPCTDLDSFMGFDKSVFNNSLVWDSGNKYFDVCIDSKTLSENYCVKKYWLFGPSIVKNKTASCELGCSNGKCLSPETICSDSDDGYDIYARGVTGNNISNSTDYCSGNRLYEYFCNGNSISYEYEDCAYGPCVNGACASPCIDSDGNSTAGRGNVSHYSSYIDSPEIISYYADARDFMGVNPVDGAGVGFFTGSNNWNYPPAHVSYAYSNSTHVGYIRAGFIRTINYTFSTLSKNSSPYYVWVLVNGYSSDFNFMQSSLNGILTTMYIPVANQWTWFKLGVSPYFLNNTSTISLTNLDQVNKRDLKLFGVRGIMLTKIDSVPTYSPTGNTGLVMGYGSPVTKYNWINYTDFCSSTKDVLEYTCYAGNLVNTSYSCQNGCQNGACIIFNIDTPLEPNKPGLLN